MHAMRTHRFLLPFVLACLLPSAVQAGGPIGNEVGRELAEARHEVRRELAAARIELESENLDVGNSLRIGRSGRRTSDEHALPKAEITPDGDFLIDGQAIDIDQGQRRELLAYRGQVIDIAKAGIDIGELSAQVAIDAVDRGLFGLLFGAMTGNLERRLEKTIREAVEPGVRLVCNSLPALLDSQQRLAQSLAAFRPYATLEADDVRDCEQEIRREFASR